MSPTRRFFDRLLLAGAVLMVLVSLVILVSTIRSIRETSENFSDNLSFYSAQTEYEIAQLLDAVDRYSDDPAVVDLDQVILRFDILWSRVFAADDGFLQEGPMRLPETSETLKIARETLEKIEPAIVSLRPDDAAAIRTIKTELRRLVPIAHRLSLAAKDSKALIETDYLQRQLRQASLTFAFILGTVFFGVLSSFLLRADRRQIRQLIVQLEDRVRKRTEDLQSANTRLAAEIVERRRNQLLAAEREARLAQAAQLAKLGYYVWDAVNDRCEFCSDQHAATHGLTPPEYIEKAGTIDGALPLAHPEDREKIRRKFKELRAGHIIEIEYRIITPLGIRRLREVARPIFDETGKVISEVGSTIDVTDQYETEMKLFEAQRMDSIGKMTGGVAHDFNNLLAVILGNLELLREVPECEDREEMIDDAIKATLRGRDLTMNMLSFARRAPLAPTELDLNVVIAGMETMLRRTLPTNISLDIALAPAIWTVMADHSLTDSSLLNLVINARDAMPDGGNLTIETANMTLGSEYLEYRGEDIEPGNYVMMAVTDTGHGIHPELADNIFEPFFTTKPITKNSGLGLSMVHGFIRQTGGAIRYYSEPGVGTTFKLFFRAANATEEPAERAQPVLRNAMEHPVRVLLVEDDDTVRKIMTRQLEQHGMTVVTASESAGAERAFRKDGPFDVVVSDIVMPGDMQGPALIRRLREIDPHLSAIFLSGYPQEAAVHGNGVGVDDLTLMKPVSRENLLNTIEKVVRS